MEQGVRTERRWGAKTADERRASRRLAIMRAAIRLYGASGYRSATVKAICAGAGLTERYFYESFANGEDLLCECFREVTRDLIIDMRAAARHDGRAPLARVRAALLVYFNQLRQRPAAARLFLLEMASVSAATQALVSVSLDQFGALLLDTLRSGRNHDRQVSPLLLRGAIGGGLHVAQAWIATGYAEPVEVVADAALRLYAVVAENLEGETRARH